MLCQSYDWYLAHKQQIASSKTASPHRSAIKQGILRLLRGA
jgi:hypothetical protein